MKFAKAVIIREETRRREKITDYIMLINIIHSQPESLRDRLTGLLDTESNGEDTGDMDRLKRLKRRGGRRHDSG